MKYPNIDREIKHGDRVTCEIGGTKITDARISIDSNGSHHICQNKQKGANADDKLGYKYSFYFSNPSHVTNLKPAEPKTLDDIQVGDVIVKDGEEYPVLMRSGQVVVYGIKEVYGYIASCNHTIDQLKHRGYTLKSEPTAPIELTVAQVAEKLGYEVKIVK